MSIFDATKPLTTDNYSTVFVPTLQANSASLAFGLDPTYVTAYGTLSTGMKRINVAGTGLIEQYNGTTWAAAAMNYLRTDGTNVMTGAITVANNVPLQWRDSGGTARSVMYVTSGNNVQIGDTANALSGGIVQVLAGASLQSVINNAIVSTLSAGGLAIQNNSGVSFYASQPASSEGFRIAHNSGFYSGYSAGGTTRTGFLQFNAGNNVALAAENGASITFAVSGTERVRIDTAGNFGFRTTPSSWGTLTAIEGSSGAMAFNNSVSMYLSQNMFYTGAQWTYKTTGPASVYVQNGGAHQWLGVVSGTAGTVATLGTNMQLDVNGSLLLNNAAAIMSAFNSTFAGGGYSSYASSGTIYGYVGSGSSLISGTLTSDFGIRATTNLIFGIGGTEVGRFTTSGNLQMQYAASTIPKVLSTTATTITVNCVVSNVLTATLTGNVAAVGWTISNPQDGQTLNIFLTQDATGTRTVAWPTSFKWPGGTAGTVSTAANAVDLLVLTYRAATGFFYAAIAKGFA